MIENIILIVLWNICSLIVFYAITDDDTKLLKKIGYILFSFAFAFLIAPIEIARAINKINYNESEQFKEKKGDNDDK